MDCRPTCCPDLVSVDLSIQRESTGHLSREIFHNNFPHLQPVMTMSTSSTAAVDHTLKGQIETLRNLVSAQFRVLQDKKDSADLEVAQISHELDQKTHDLEEMTRDRDTWRGKYYFLLQQLNTTMKKLRKYEENDDRMCRENESVKTDHIRPESEQNKLTSYVHDYIKLFIDYTRFLVSEIHRTSSPKIKAKKMNKKRKRNENKIETTHTIKKRRKLNTNGKSKQIKEIPMCQDEDYRNMVNNRKQYMFSDCIFVQILQPH